ncbi:hypothetical protein [Streptomyces sp. NPDC048473]|uniref:hypothetical protein n=1 Tax=Streptomyces sp. NPDC048473 TaxID=3365556 RepID=UPI003718E7CB
MADFLASIDDVLNATQAALEEPAVPAAPVVPVVPVAPAVPAAPEKPVSTLTDVEYVRVGPQISARLNPPKPPPALPPVPVVPPVEASVPAEPVASAETEPPVEAPAEAPVETVVEEAEAGPWWQKKPTETEPSAGTGAEPSVEAAVAAAVVAGVAAGVAAGAAPETAGTVTVPREPNPRWRWLLYNGGAAAAGHLALWSLAGDPMAGAHYMARMTASVPQLAAAGLTLVAAYGGWRVAGLIKGLPGLPGLAVRPLGALGAALWGAGSAPLVQTALDAIEPWGTLLSPLLAAGPLAAACWYGLDRRAAHARLIRPVRWLARIPLATVVVSSLLYTPGALL